jgi:hypothetical protein
MIRQGLGKPGWQDGDPILSCFPIAHQDRAGREVQVLHPKAKKLHQAHSGSVKKTGH